MADLSGGRRSGERSRAARLVVDARPFDRAGGLLVEALDGVLATSECVRLAIPGGTALQSMVGARAGLGDSWQSVALTWVDERCVPFEDIESNRGAAMRMGLLQADDVSHAGRGPARLLPLYQDGESPAQSVARVAALFSKEFSNGLDVVLLGMGADGHVASLFPALSMPREGMVAHVSESPKPPADRITLTRTALATAKHVILVAAGESKRGAVRRLLAGDARLPAKGLEGLVVVTDLDEIEKRGD